MARHTGSVPHPKLLYEEATPDLNLSVVTSEAVLYTSAPFSNFSFSSDLLFIVFASGFYLVRFFPARGKNLSKSGCF